MACYCELMCTPCSIHVFSPPSPAPGRSLSLSGSPGHNTNLFQTSSSPNQRRHRIGQAKRRCWLFGTSFRPKPRSSVGHLQDSSNLAAKIPPEAGGCRSLKFAETPHNSLWLRYDSCQQAAALSSTGLQWRRAMPSPIKTTPPIGPAPIQRLWLHRIKE
jgi:hypothetical protein